MTEIATAMHQGFGTTDTFLTAMHRRIWDTEPSLASPHAQAEAREAGQASEKKKPVVVKFGLNHVTHLVETGKAQLVIIAHDVRTPPLLRTCWAPGLGMLRGVILHVACTMDPSVADALSPPWPRPK